MKHIAYPLSSDLNVAVKKKATVECVQFNLFSTVLLFVIAVVAVAAVPAAAAAAVVVVDHVVFVVHRTLFNSRLRG